MTEPSAYPNLPEEIATGEGFRLIQHFGSRSQPKRIWAIQRIRDLGIQTVCGFVDERSDHVLHSHRVSSFSKLKFSSFN